MLWINVDSNFVNGRLADNSGLCIHRAPRDGNLLRCDFMPDWAMEELVELTKEKLINNLDISGVLGAQDPNVVPEWIRKNPAAHLEFIVRADGEQIVQNMTDGLAIQLEMKVE